MTIYALVHRNLQLTNHVVTRVNVGESFRSKTISVIQFPVHTDREILQDES